MVGDDQQSITRELIDAVSQGRAGSHSGIAAGRAVGATIGALGAAAIGSLVSLPALGFAFLFATMVTAGRTLGGRATERRLAGSSAAIWDQVDIVRRRLENFGVPPEKIGETLRHVLRSASVSAVLHNPELLARLLPGDTFEAAPKQLGPAGAPGAAHQEDVAPENSPAERYP